MDIHIVMAEDVMANLEQRCIDVNDAVAAVRGAEREGVYFEDANGVRLCSLQLEHVTYWVSYTPRGDKLEITGTYCHRMKFEEAK